MSDSDSPELTVVALTDALKGLVKWKQVAIHLPKISARIIETIKEENSNDVADEKLALFTKWLKVHSKATWNDVIIALQKADENALAESLKEKYCKEKASESDHSDSKEHYTSLQSSSDVPRNAEFLGGSLMYNTKHSQSKQIPRTSKFNKSVADRDRQSARKSFTSDLTDVEPLEYCDGEVTQNKGEGSLTEMAAEQQERLVFSKFGLNIARKDIDDLLSSMATHPVIASIILLALASLIIVVLLAVSTNKGVSKEDIEEGTPDNHCTIPFQSYSASPNSHDEYETIAQSVCTSLAIRKGINGWTYAVNRQCRSDMDSCEAICASEALHKQDDQTKSNRWSCLGAVHVYGYRSSSSPSNSSHPSMGLKIYWSINYHKNTACGPNYCCCHAS